MPPLERQLPLPEMSAAQLARYRRALVRSLRRCREEQPQYQENDVIDVRLHAADAIVFLDFSPFRCACRAIRRSPERADFWKWLLCIAAAAVRYSGRRSPNTPAMPSSTSCRPRERSGDSSRR
jgi:hypothetical protein